MAPDHTTNRLDAHFKMIGEVSGDLVAVSDRLERLQERMDALDKRMKQIEYSMTLVGLRLDRIEREREGA